MLNFNYLDVGGYFIAFLLTVCIIFMISHLNVSKYNDVEKALLDQYSQMMSMTGMSSSEANKNVEDMLDQAIKESKEEGTYYLPQNLGDIILGDAESDNSTINKIAESIMQKLPKKKAEGVTDEDIRWWWNLNDIERRIMLKQDDIANGALFISELQKSNESSKEKAAQKAAEKVRKYHPIYGDSDDITPATGADRPLPYELKDRINIYIEKRARENPEKFKNEIEQSSTFNALIRKEIKAGASSGYIKANRQKALDILWTSYSQYRSGNKKTGRQSLERALALDPDFAYANIVRAEFALKEEDWDSSRIYFEKGLALIKQPNQPLSPTKSINISLEEVEGDSRCFLGYVYVKLAQQANYAGDTKSEEKYLKLANLSLKSGLSLNPGEEARKIAEGILRGFKKIL